MTERRRALPADFWRLWTASSISAVGDGVRAARGPCWRPGSPATRRPWRWWPWPPACRGCCWRCRPARWETLFDSAAQASLPAVVPAAGLERANGRLYAGDVVGGAFAGAPLGGALFALAAAVPFGVDSASFLVAAYAGLGLTSDGAVAFALLAVLGATGMLWNVLSASFRQAVVPSRLMGRVNSVYRGATWGVIPLGAALGGVTADRLGLRAPFLLAAAVLVVATVVALPHLRSARLEAARAAAAEG